MSDLDTIYDAILAGTVTHEQAADLFMQSAAGQATGVAREEILARLHAKLPTQQALAAQLRDYLAMVPAQFLRGAPRPTGPLQ